MDDYSASNWNMTSGEIFCHGSNFLDDDDCTLDVGAWVWFTTSWDAERERWQAVDIAGVTSMAELLSFGAEYGMDQDANFRWQFEIEMSAEHLW